MGGDEAQSGEGVEDEPAGGACGSARVEAVDLSVGAGTEAGLAFDEGEDEQCQADDVDECVDALVGVQEHRGDRERALDVAVAPFDDFLAFVAAQDFGRLDLGGQVGQQAYQPSVAASVSSVAWSKCQARVGFPVSGSVAV